LRAFERHGVTDYLGYEGSHIPRDMLRIPRSRFRAVDLGRISDLGRRFDIARSLEVHQIVPKPSSAFWCGPPPSSCSRPPLQGKAGAGHKNLRWQS
jgi:hypothetical protein